MAYRNVADVRWWLLHPANLVHFNVKELQAISKFLSTNKITPHPACISRKKQKLRQVLTSILFPGYISNAKQEAWVQRLDRRAQLIKTPNRAISEKTVQGMQFAYEQIPRSDFVDNREEILQIRLDKTFTATVALADLRPVLIKGKLRPYIRIYAYLWRYDCRSIDPDTLESIRLGDTTHTLNDSSSQKLFKKGYHHMDVTDSIPWNVVTGKQPNSGQSCYISLHVKGDTEPPMYISLCSVVRKTSSQLTAGLIMQDICHCINQSFAKHKDLTLAKMESIYSILELGSETTANALEDAKKKYNDTIAILGTDCLGQTSADDSCNADLCLVGDEVVSLRDPITLVRIDVPGKGLHCTHSGSFDVQTFLDFNEHVREWKCPHCFDRINGVQDIAVSGTFLQYLKQFPDEDRIVRRTDGAVFKALASEQTRKRSLDTREVEAFNPNKFRVIECGNEESVDNPEDTEEPALPVKLSTNWAATTAVDVVEID